MKNLLHNGWIALTLLAVNCGRVGYEADQGSNLEAGLSLGCESFDGLLCEDFEGDFSKWSDSTSTGQLRIEDGAGRSGMGLRAITPGGEAVLRLTTSSAGWDETFYARAWLRIDSGETLAPWTVFMELRQSPDTGQKISFDGTFGDAAQLVSKTGGGDSNTRTSPGFLDRNSWHCIELFVDSSIDGEAWAALDGVRIVAPESDRRPAEGRYNSFLVGASSESTMVSVSMDDIRIASSIVGCD